MMTNKSFGKALLGSRLVANLVLYEEMIALAWHGHEGCDRSGADLLCSIWLQTGSVLSHRRKGMAMSC